MKILTVIDSFHTGGKERRLIELLKGLTKENIECELIVLSRIVTYPALHDLNVKIHYVERKIKQDPLVFFKIYQIIRNRKPTLVQSWSSMASVYVAPVVKLLNIPFVNAIIAHAPLRLKPFSQPWLRSRLTFPCSDAIVANSYAGVRSFKSPVDKSYVIHNGFDFQRTNHITSAQEIREELGITTNAVVGMIGKFQIRKDYHTYLKAALKVVKERADVTFLAVGDGEMLEECQQLISNEYDGRIIFTGRRTDVESVINVFDVGVLATNHKVHGEGISNALMEYMVMSKPVIATEGGGTAELVLDKQVGYIIPTGDIGALVKKVHFLLDHPDISRQLGLAGRERIHENFNLTRMTQEYIQLYRKLLTI